MKKCSSVIVPILLVFVVFSLQGCDAVDGGTIYLQPKEAVFRYAFSADDLQVGQTSVIPAISTVDLGDALLADGFSKGEVLTATISSVMLERINPIGVSLSFIDDVSVDLQATGVTNTSIADHSNLPDNRLATLTVRSGVDITGFITRPSFGSTLSILPAEIVAGEEYVLEAKVSIRIEVEGV